MKAGNIIKVIGEKKSGIYKITCLKNNIFYIGSTSSFYERWGNHIRRLNAGNHDNNHLQNTWDKYGIISFKFEVLDYCNVSDLITREQYYLDTLLYAQEYIRSNGKDKRFRELGFNICPIAGKAILWTDKMREERSLSYSGENNPNYGNNWDEARKDKVRGNNNGMRIKGGHSKESKQKISAAFTKENHPLWGKSHSEISKQKMSLAKKGKVYPNRYDNSKVVVCTNIESGEIINYPSRKSASIAFKCSDTHIGRCISSGKVFNGFKFFYK